MSVTTTTVAPAAADAAGRPARKFPPPCWTQEETLALIDAYRERWYALRRGYLRTADWDAVAAAVTNRCPDASPAKTSAQCRHKMEKLRQRYRAEKQRSLSYPSGRFFSSWFFFENMDAMENGTSVSVAGSNREPENRENSASGFPLKTFLDQNILKLKLSTKNRSTKVDGNSTPNFGFSQGVRAKNSSKNADKKVGSDFSSKVFNGGYSSYMDIGSDKDEEEMDFHGGFGAKNVDDGMPGLTGFKGKNFGKILGNSRSGFEFESLGGKGFEASDGFHMQTLGDESMVPPRLRLKRIGKVNRSFDADQAKDGSWVSLGTRRKYAENLDSDLDSSGGLNGFYDQSRLGFEKRGFGCDSGGRGEAKRGRSSIDEMVSSIKMLGEGFMKMENMKMDMAREMEKNRMEMEMKRNELILESQRQIVDALAQSLMEIKRKKVKITAAPET
ncbi:protein FIP2-like [Coffea eugenioides]|uniref:protein FIP2-like n=1 Tax=Coffea eugenioides TaxID=49369 RepID=UPI000F60A260|nr:protein FIP2-like [Coffea eugenioides]